jgi:hypothetical protein
MSCKRARSLILIFLVCILTLSLDKKPTAQGAVNIYASSVQAGCYLAHHDQCKIHVDPFTINLTSGEKLVFFQLVTIRGGSGAQQVIYDFRPDQSNPVPFLGNTYTPSEVAKDFAATCGEQYMISLQGQDTGDSNPYNLGLTGLFTCPAGEYYLNLPLIRK